MASTPSTGWVRCSARRKASAGGQDEQPSEVNSSTSTGTGSPAVNGQHAASTHSIPSNRIVPLLSINHHRWSK